MAKVVDAAVTVPVGAAEDECPVCLEPPAEGAYEMQCCGARMHLACLERWLENGDSCPICRSTEDSLVSSVRERAAAEVLERTYTMAEAQRLARERLRHQLCIGLGLTISCGAFALVLISTMFMITS